ncbi:hypothetical protein [Pseudalkalibacillus caeni]|uniref:Uncharacterized protein n=1 Tax=Exobacillus caeni TaxID=2574798 RepID=A0A5R9F086_9BACL|nr:hypothetical protein [Pseudalkalibacillus caeni]TLS37022.1 hypothetical protein FCL54_10840 [Pseudalkalibacillus caeni]
MINKLLIKAYSSDEVRFAVVWNGRLYTFHLKQKEGNWHFISYDKDLLNNKHLMDELFLLLQENDEAQSKLSSYDIPLELIRTEEQEYLL